MVIFSVITCSIISSTSFFFPPFLELQLDVYVVISHFIDHLITSNQRMLIEHQAFVLEPLMFHHRWNLYLNHVLSLANLKWNLNKEIRHSRKISFFLPLVFLILLIPFFISERYSSLLSNIFSANTLALISKSVFNFFRHIDSYFSHACLFLQALSQDNLFSCTLVNSEGEYIFGWSFHTESLFD